jgi:uncharacterized membrane protein YdbT with pleckstrin-like domain
MTYADSLLAKGEVVRYRDREHWLAPLSDARNGLLLLLGAIVLAFVGLVTLDLLAFIRQLVSLVCLIVGLVGFGWVGWVYMEWRAEEYIITNRRVLKVEGIINKKSGDSSLEKINDAVLSQNLLGRILGYGDLDVLTASEEAIDRYKMLNRVVAFKKAMLDAKNELEDASAGRRPVASPATGKAAGGSSGGKAGSSDEVTATLAKLADLRDRGAITAAEYESKKAELLNRL